ncbi:aspartyl protease family protein [Phenylobacterium sp.]|uniref:aspartyl protease family protein n=1 Tax=Phenylobacterium sp. TaxID=1871053 RepID=UPI0035B1A481
MKPDRRRFTQLAGAAGLAALTPLAGAWAQTADPTPAPGAEPADAQPADDGPSQVAMARDRSLRMLAPVMINGQGPYQFLVDTGANRSCIRKDLAETLALPPGPMAAVSTIAGRSLRPTVVIDELFVGRRSQRRVKVPLLRMTADDPADGVLGVDWLKNRRLLLDFEAKVLEIAAPRRDTSGDKRVVVPARRRSGQLTLIDADSSGRRISALIDSGSELTIGNAPMRKLVEESSNGLLLPPTTITMVTVVGETFHGEMLNVPFMRLGGLTLGNVPVVFAKSHVFRLWGLQNKPTVVLGMDLLSEFTSVALDFGRSTVRFDIA